MRFGAGGRAARVEGLERLDGVSHFYIGADKSAWRTNVPHYRGVAYRDVWPGIDLVF